MRRPMTVVLALSVVALGGCASSRVLVHATSTASVTTQPTTTASTTTTTTTGPNPTHYVAQLRAAELNLAAAERRIPARARTPRALARSTALLAGAVSQLARRLGAISPPDAVVSEHAKLVAIVRAYAGRLRVVTGLARRPGGEVRASRLLVSATNGASAAFIATLSKIYSTLGVRQP